VSVIVFNPDASRRLLSYAIIRYGDAKITRSMKDAAEVCMKTGMPVLVGKGWIVPRLKEKCKVLKPERLVEDITWSASEDAVAALVDTLEKLAPDAVIRTGNGFTYTLYGTDNGFIITAKGPSYAEVGYVEKLRKNRWKALAAAVAAVLYEDEIEAKEIEEIRVRRQAIKPLKRLLATLYKDSADSIRIVAFGKNGRGR